MNSNPNYILVSEDNQYTNVYDIKIKDTIIINGKNNIASNIKLDDNIEFYSNTNKKISLNVKYIGYSNFPSSCFSKDCIVDTYRGKVKVMDLCIGDKILTPLGLYSSIKCILVTKVNAHIEMMIHPNGLIITGYHPIKINNKWMFPIDINLFENKLMFIDYVYSIGLEDYCSFIVNEFEVIGLNHGIVNDSIASHTYFGTEKVIKDIFKLSPNGYCEIEPKQITRDPKTFLVNGIINNKNIENNIM